MCLKKYHRESTSGNPVHHPAPTRLDRGLKLAVPQVYVGPFVSNFPKAKVFVAPGQFSWPIDLPLGFRVDGVLDNGVKFPFSDEIDHAGAIGNRGRKGCS
jgi:hypothetical protein